MLQTLKNAWATKEIRSKLLFTLFILLLYRIGTVIPVPFVDTNNFSAAFGGTILDYMNILSGGSLEVATLFALGVSPYINASIIMQLLAVAFPKLGELGKEEGGKKIMNMITRCVTIVLAIVTAIGYFFLLKNGGMLTATATDEKLGWLYAIVIITCYVAGASIIMWLAERINDKGLGNGISIILFANIIAVIPSSIYKIVDFVVLAFNSEDPVWLRATGAIIFALFIVAAVIAMTVFVIWVTGSERRIPIQYAKKVVGRKMYGGQSSNLPIKLNMTGVMPVIFASSIVSLVPTILALCGVTSKTGDDATFWEKTSAFLASDGWFYPVCLFILIIAFAYFYTQISFNPIEVANNLKKQGGAIPGIRQGRPTSDYIKKILNKVTLVGALFLSVVAILPMIAGPHIFTYIIEWILGVETSYAKSIASQFTFGGTSLLIVVGVVLETFRELEAQLTMRSYKGFLN